MVIAPERSLTASSSAPALIWSALAFCLSLRWLWQPQRCPSPRAIQPHSAPSWACCPCRQAALPRRGGVWGTVVAWLAARQQPTRARRTPCFSGWLLRGFNRLPGYAMAMLGPPVLFGAVLAGAWRWHGGPWAVGVPLLVAVLAWPTGLADGDVLLRYLDVITTTVARAGPAAVLLFS
jgi:hypothetical protein